MSRFLLFLLKMGLPIAVLVAGGMYAQQLINDKPEVRKRPSVDRTPVVEVTPINREDYQVTLHASGLVKARTQTNLVAEVSGKIESLSPNFQAGGYVSEGEVLLVLDDSNYQDSMAIARSNIAAQEAALRQLNQEEHNTRATLKLTQDNLRLVQQNLQLAQRTLNTVKRKQPSVKKNLGLIQRNLNLAKRNYQLTLKNINLAKRNLNIGRQELNRTQKLWDQRLIPRNQYEAEQQKVVQLEQSIVQQEQTLVQHQQNMVQLEQQLSQQDQSELAQDQSTLGQEQQLLQQRQAINQQLQSIENLKGQLATYAPRRDSINANLQSAKTQLLQQQRNLGRTEIIAPYDGRILEQRVDVGQYVGANSVLAVLYATDYVEVDMPLTLAQYELLGMPESFRNQGADFASIAPVTFKMPFGKSQFQWQGRITGTRAALNEQSRQITVVARIDNPYERVDSAATTLKIGQYLSAQLQGKTFEGVYVFPPETVRQNREVLLREDGKVLPVAIEVLWNTEQAIVARSDTELAGRELITTALPQATEGMKVALPGEKKRRGRGQRPGGKPDTGESSDTPSKKPDREACRQAFEEGDEALMSQCRARRQSGADAADQQQGD